MTYINIIFVVVPVLSLLWSSIAQSSIIGESDEVQIKASQVVPLYNWHWKHKRGVGYEKRGLLTPVTQKTPPAADENLLNINNTLNAKSSKGETIYIGLLLESNTTLEDVIIEITAFSGNNGQLNEETDIKIVTSWFQSGVTTKISKKHSYLTYELLLDNDQIVGFNDVWTPADNGDGWIYQPPEIEQRRDAITTLLAGQKKRLLIKGNIPFESKAGIYKANLKIKNNNIVLKEIEVELEVLPITLKEVDPKENKLLTYTGIAIDPLPGRSGSYLNANRLHGDYIRRKAVFRSYIQDIKNHGFNSVTIKDWRSPYLDEVLEIMNEVGIAYPILHANSPINRSGMKKTLEPFPIINKSVVDIFKKYGYEPIFFGVDEAGGNKLLYKQLDMNRKVHALGGKIFNAFFWQDRESVLKITKHDTELQFDMMTYSMGSHGQKDFFNALPLKTGKDDLLPVGTEQLAYWHPNEENPLANRLFMGFWFWASGLSGIAPHGHYFPSHIERIIDDTDVTVKRSHKSSAYDDWAYWLPPGDLRHHSIVYPSQNGPVPTLQWEGINDGVTDFRYIKLLEKRILNNTFNSGDELIATQLMDEIRKSVLVFKGSYLDDRKSALMQTKIDGWRIDIQKLLVAPAIK